MLDKSQYSFLIAFARQLANALDSDDGDLAVTLGSLASSMALLDADWSVDLGYDDGGVPEGVDESDAPGDDTPLGAALARIAELEQRAAATVVGASKRLCGVGRISDAASGESQLDMGSQRRKPSVLKARKARRGKK